MKTFAKLLVAFCIMSGIIFAASQSAFATEVTGNLPVLNGIYAKEQGVIGTEGGYSSNNGKWNYKMSDTSEYKGIFGKIDVPVWYAGSGHSVTLTVDASKEAKYYIGIQGCCYRSGVRYITVSVNGVETGDDLCEQTNVMTKDVSAEPITMRAGQNVITLKANGGICRVDHVVFISAESYDEAKEKYTNATTVEDIINTFGTPEIMIEEDDVTVSSSNLSVCVSWIPATDKVLSYQLSLNNGESVLLDNSARTYTFTENVNYGENEITFACRNELGQETIIRKSIRIENIGGKCGENLSWSFSEDGTLTISGSGEMESYASLNDVPWSDLRSLINQIIIQEGVTKIGDCAFGDCSVPTSITIPNGVEYLGRYAFGGCTGLESITVPDSVETIGQNAFSGCTKLESVTIGSGVKIIEDFAFSSCVNIKNVYYNGTKEEWKAIDIIGYFNDNLQYATKHYLGEEEPEISNVTWSFADDGTLTISGTGKMEDYYYAEMTPWYSVCDEIKKVVIEAGVTSIGSGAFWGCYALESVVIGSGVTEIGMNAFTDCFELENVVMGDKVEVIKPYAFFGCDLIEHVTLPRSVKELKEDVFVGCDSLTAIYYEGTESEWEVVIKDKSSIPSDVEVVCLMKFNVEFIRENNLIQVVTEVESLPEDTVLFASTYDENGKALEIKLVSSEGETTFDATDVKDIKVFAWGDYFSPVIQNVIETIE